MWSWKKCVCVLVTSAVTIIVASAGMAEELTMGAIGTTSDTYTLAVAWSNVLKETGSSVSITPLEGGGTIQLLRGVATQKWDIGFIASPHYENALEGTLKFSKDPAQLVEKYKDVRVLFGITTGMGQYITRADSGISRIQDLKGKKVAIGRPGGMAGTVTTRLFKEEGIDLEKKDFDAQYLSYDAAIDEMRNNRLDAGLMWGGIPHSAIYNFSRQIPIRFLPIDKFAFNSFKNQMPQGKYYKLVEFTPEELKKVYGDGVVQAVPADFWTFQMMVVTHKDVPEEKVYEITRAFWENIDEIRGASVSLGKINHEEALSALSGVLHPGAKKFYEEKGWM